MPAPEPPFKRFLRHYAVDPATGCWNWTSHTYRNGYGSLKVFGKMVIAHRFAWELHRGPIPHGMEILHSCDNHKCVNPDHMRVGTHAENMAEARARGRMPRGADHPMAKFGNPRKGIKNLQSVQVKVLGKRYGSKNEAEKALGLGGGTVSYWIKHKPAKASVISREEYERNE